jgi:O-antigen/teichoic acid export membrane protein
MLNRILPKSHKLKDSHNKSILNLVGILVSGSALAQLLQLLSHVLLARIYGASQFGILAQVSAVGSIIAVASTLQMHQAMVLPRSIEESGDLFATGFFASTLISIISLIALSIWKNNVFGNASSSLLPLFCAFFALALCYGNLLRGWQTARGNFKILSIFTIIHSVFIVFFQVNLGLLKIDNGLVYGILIGEFVTSLFFLLLNYAPKISSFTQLLIHPPRILKNIKAYYQFSFVGTIQELVSVSVLMLPLFMFSRAYGEDVGGQYAMANKFAWAPVLLVGNAFTQVVFHNFSGLSINSLWASSMLKFGKMSISVLFLGSAGALIFPFMLPLILGNQWMMAGELGGWVLIWATFFFLSIPYRVCYRVLRRQSTQLVIDALILFTLFILFSYSLKISPLVMMGCVAIMAILQNLLLIWIMWFRLRLIRVKSK